MEFVSACEECFCCDSLETWLAGQGDKKMKLREWREQNFPNYFLALFVITSFFSMQEKNKIKNKAS